MFRRFPILPALLLLSPLAAAAADPDPARGAAIAERWCTECHLIAPEGPGRDVGPAFAAMPLIDDERESALRAWLFDPHEPMPDLELAPSQIEDIIAYMRTLEGPGGE